MDSGQPARSGTFAEYARHRGVSKNAVSKMRKKDWFRQVVDVRSGKEFIADFELADRLWAQHADQTRASIDMKERLSRIERASPPAAGDRDDDQAEPGAGEDAVQPDLSLTMSLADATKADKYWSAMRKKQDFEIAAATLVDAAERDSDETTRIVFCRTKLLSIPSKIKAALPHLTHGDLAAIDGLIREALEDLRQAGRAARGEAA